jgi:site-specific recombinase XerD
MEFLKAKNKIRSISGFVFTTKASTKTGARNLPRAFYSARKKADLADVRFHDLRHTFATRLVQAGIDLYVVKELLGHKTISMTMRYAHHYPELLRLWCRSFRRLRGTKRGTAQRKRGYSICCNPLN